MEGVIVGAGNSAGARFRDPVWRGGDDTVGDVAGLGGVGCVFGKEGCLAGTGTGVGTGESWVVVLLGWLGVEGRGAGLSS